MNIDATGPDEIRAAFTTAIDNTGERTAEMHAISAALAEAADRYESLTMNPATVEHLRAAAAATQDAGASLATADDLLHAALDDFNNRDGAVAEAVTDAANLASAAILTDSTQEGPSMPADRPADHAAVGPSTEVNGRDDEPSDEPSDESDEHTAATGAAPGEDGDELDDEDDPPDVGEGYAAFYGGDGYLDWSSPQPAGGRSLELGFDADAVVLDLTEDELHSLIGELGAVLDNPDRDTGGLATDDGAIDLERNPDGTITIEFNRDDGERVTVTVPATHVRAAHAQLIEDLPARAHTPWCTGRHDPYGSCEAVEGLVDGARLELTGGRAATRLWIDGMNLTDVDQVDTVIAKLTAYRDRLANAPADPGPTAEPGNADGTPR